MERKGQRNTRRQRRSSSWLFSPIIIAQLVVVMLLAGVGVAFALPAPHDISTTSTSPWAGAATISEGSLGATSYSLVYDMGLQNVVGVKVTVKNNDTVAAHSGTVDVAFNNGGLPIKGVAVATVTALGQGLSIETSTITLTSQIAIGANLDSLRIIITQTN